MARRRDSRLSTAGRGATRNRGGAPGDPRPRPMPRRDAFYRRLLTGDDFAIPDHPVKGLRMRPAAEETTLAAWIRNTRAHSRALALTSRNPNKPAPITINKQTTAKRTLERDTG
ncbi:hypothetical protein V9T40_008363 [Parthenolecanium corni]|uniref:Uncharacterized protein n=1 Tax=Parthenolecanium corni TaxID=536013 RepID=A0AAN9TLJ4_9HEMI